MIGSPIRARTDTLRTATDQVSSVDSPGTTRNYYGPTAYYRNTNLDTVAVVSPSSVLVDLLYTTTTTTRRMETATDTFTTTTTIEVIGEVDPVVSPVVPPAVPPIVTPATLPAHVYLRAVGADIGGASRVRAVTPDGSVAFDDYAFETTFTGGVRVATGDVTGDGVDDILTAAGDGGGPRLRILDGATGATVRDGFAFADTLRVGAFVAAADVNGDGFADYAVTAGLGGGSRVALFDGKTGERLVADFLAFDADSRTGFTVALGDVTGDGVPEIVVGQLGGGSQVRVFDLTGKLLSEFTASEPSFTGGAYVAVGDVNGDGRAEVLTGAGLGGGPRVRAFDVAPDGSATEVQNGFTFDSTTRDGVKVGTGTTAVRQTVVIAGVQGRTRQNVAGQPPGTDDDAPFGPSWLGGLWVS